MIKYYGIFQLVKVIKKDKTKKNANTVVYFSAASRRSETDTDFKLFKAYGNTADYFLRNLQKNSEGKYQSRKMYLDGYVETYNDNQDVTCIADLTPDLIPAEIGLLKQNITVKAKTQIKVQKDSYVVSSLEFVDKPKDNGVEIILNSELNDITKGKDDSLKESNNKQTEIKKIASEKNKILDDDFKVLDDDDIAGDLSDTI